MSEPDRTVIFDDENPEWTKADFARALRGDAIPAHIREAFGPGKRGRPVGTHKPGSKKSVTLRLDPDVLERWRATGPGWQARMNSALRAALPA
ncbi:BrnA antitoxin family protein [Novosphingobium sp.]|uniref:BrnA antitoxin family protein n=1 Tax=Novosphingobium sp. TaxID=1874826 RepID=UPI003BAAC4AB